MKKDHSKELLNAFLMLLCQIKARDNSLGYSLESDSGRGVHNNTVHVLKVSLINCLIMINDRLA